MQRGNALKQHHFWGKQQLAAFLHSMSAAGQKHGCQAGDSSPLLSGMHTGRGHSKPRHIPRHFSHPDDVRLPKGAEMA